MTTAQQDRAFVPDEALSETIPLESAPSLYKRGGTPHATRNPKHRSALERHGSALDHVLMISSPRSFSMINAIFGMERMLLNGTAVEGIGSVEALPLHDLGAMVDSVLVERPKLFEFLQQRREKLLTQVMGGSVDPGSTCILMKDFHALDARCDLRGGGSAVTGEEAFLAEAGESSTETSSAGSLVVIEEAQPPQDSPAEEAEEEPPPFPVETSSDLQAAFDLARFHVEAQGVVLPSDGVFTADVVRLVRSFDESCVLLDYLRMTRRMNVADYHRSMRRLDGCAHHAVKRLRNGVLRRALKSSGETPKQTTAAAS